ncbi:MAG: sigma-70 family RNA polymerase sigma factor [Thiomicrorhabdus sp.]|nr:sigma-70 family RNA polymerase sigma factor [Thiomicrorhabdus sp.]
MRLMTKSIGSESFSSSKDHYFSMAGQHPLLDKETEQELFSRLDVKLRLLSCLLAPHVGLKQAPFDKLTAQEHSRIAKEGRRLARQLELDTVLTEVAIDSIKFGPVSEICNKLRGVYPNFVLLLNTVEQLNHAQELCSASLLKNLLTLVTEIQKTIETITQHNLRLVIKIAREHNFLGLPIMDVIQEGNLGLLKAIEKYQLEQSTRFSTYAWWWIKQHITIYVRKQGGIVRKPENVIDRMLKLLRLFPSTSDYQSKNTIRNIARKTDFTEKEIVELLQYAAPDISLEFPAAANEESNLHSRIPDNEFRPDNIPITGVGLTNLLSHLSPLLRKIVILRFGLFEQSESSFREIGEAIGKSTERTRQLYNDAMAQLKTITCQERD